MLATALGVPAAAQAGLLAAPGNAPAQAATPHCGTTIRASVTLTATLGGNAANDNQFGLDSQIHAKGTGNHAAGNKVVNCHYVKCVEI